MRVLTITLPYYTGNMNTHTQTKNKKPADESSLAKGESAPVSQHTNAHTQRH